MPSGILTCCTRPFWSSSLWLFGCCLLSLRCLISALTQAGGGDLLFRFASAVQSCCGEGGALQADVAVCGEHSPCSSRAARSFGALSPGAAPIFPPRPAAQAARSFGALSPSAVRLFPPRPQRTSGERSSMTSAMSSVSLLFNSVLSVFCVFLPG